MLQLLVRHLKGWIADLKEKKATLLEVLQEAKEPTLPELLGKYLDLRREERTGWTSKGQLKGTANAGQGRTAAISGRLSCPSTRSFMRR